MSIIQHITSVNNEAEKTGIACRAVISLLHAMRSEFFSNSASTPNKVIVIATDDNSQESQKRVAVFTKNILGLIPTPKSTDVPCLTADWFRNATLNLFISPEYVTSGELQRALLNMNASVFVYLKNNDVLLGKSIEEIAALGIPCVVSQINLPANETDVSES